MKDFNAKALLSKIESTATRQIQSVYMSNERWEDFKGLLLEEGFVKNPKLDAYYKMSEDEDGVSKYLDVTYGKISKSLHFSAEKRWGPG